ncbi:progestin and adipoQ receptor family member 4 [Anopheles aquasalis]|uniref:progestin and adipoQ receptor family member 4 n=1 Tax=Anopheles aquasalis TaxID=42839 RepID=UPI00215B02E0|nr:progestin and adipoQ receptor family member 4 [Anopheles aquasalis]XP_050087424.1 progestin and adipoQ receptor family member 4 [Anopheles aquasalis]XP_050087433.1 progestin and adipoQ receptor family member 4 [Anopheles aquasalis]XP_050087442.1 progestin and adipoQ receptor family member 4 [Anopheles aquasalis]XP_050087451.1 progestin and adipoQ receptor family member 4 [Anopheles aquasalis]
MEPPAIEPQVSIDPPLLEPAPLLSTENIVPPSDASDAQSNGGASSTMLKQMHRLLTPPADLLEWKDMPQHLQFNPYVLTGYRPLQGVKGCLSSLFYVHNETINILTHGIPIVYILATVPAMMPWEKDYRFLSWCHLVGSVAPWCGSFVYHLFMNLECGEGIYYRLLQLDMLGIWISQSFGALPMVTATVYCWNTPLKWLFIISYSLLCIWGLFKAMTASSPWQRRLCFLLPFSMRIILTLLRISKMGGGNPTSLTHVFLQDAVSAVGGIIGAMHIPEKWFPGSVDIYLNSHNIMHVLVVVAVYSMHQATVRDIEWMQRSECNGLSSNTTLNIDHVNGSHLEL